MYDWLQPQNKLNGKIVKSKPHYYIFRIGGVTPLSQQVATETKLTFVNFHTNLSFSVPGQK